MADGTKIEWADATWNPIVGCSVVSPGCTNCYAMRLAGTRLKHHPSRAGLTRDTKAGPVWTGETRLDEKALLQPLRWRRPRKIFVCAHSDLFHETTPDAWIDRVFAIMALCPQHTFQVLTKRPGRMRDYFTTCPSALRRGAIIEQMHAAMRASGYIRFTAIPWPLPNVWLGVSAEDQARADERIPVLLATPAAKRFVSIEPMLGIVDLRSIWVGGVCRNALVGTAVDYHDDEDGLGCSPIEISGPRLDWVICGGESGPGARPMHPDWVRSLRDQCAAVDVTFFFKQWGEWAPADDFPSEIQEDYDVRGLTCDASIRIGKRAAGRLLDGVEHFAFPET